MVVRFAITTPGGPFGVSLGLGVVCWVAPSGSRLFGETHLPRHSRGRTFGVSCFWVGGVLFLGLGGLVFVLPHLWWGRWPIASSNRSEGAVFCWCGGVVCVGWPPPALACSARPTSPGGAGGGRVRGVGVSGLCAGGLFRRGLGWLASPAGGRGAELPEAAERRGWDLPADCSDCWQWPPPALACSARPTSPGIAGGGRLGTAGD